MTLMGLQFRASVQWTLFCGLRRERFRLVSDGALSGAV
jgi:hypothetical protein